MSVILRKALIEVVPHTRQRYPTVGDWLEEHRGDWRVRVSDMGDWRYAFLVAIHELVEMALCQQRGIRELDVTNFDLRFESQRPAGNTDEPGDAKDAPYRQEHRFAENIERQLAHELGVNWREYEKIVETL